MRAYSEEVEADGAKPRNSKRQLLRPPLRKLVPITVLADSRPDCLVGSTQKPT